MRMDGLSRTPQWRSEGISPFHPVNGSLGSGADKSLRILGVFCIEFWTVILRFLKTGQLCQPPSKASDLSCSVPKTNTETVTKYFVIHSPSHTWVCVILTCDAYSYRCLKLTPGSDSVALGRVPDRLQNRWGGVVSARVKTYWSGVYWNELLRVQEFRVFLLCLPPLRSLLESLQFPGSWQVTCSNPSLHFENLYLTVYFGVKQHDKHSLCSISILTLQERYCNNAYFTEG